MKYISILNECESVFDRQGAVLPFSQTGGNPHVHTRFGLERENERRVSGRFHLLTRRKSVSRAEDEQVDEDSNKIPCLVAHNSEETSESMRR